MKMKKAKLIRNVLAVLVVLAAVVCVSCDALLENGRRGNITINLPPVSSSARAISADKINDLKGDIESYRVIVKVNGQRTEKRGGGGNYSFEMPVGVKIEITVECLNSSRDVIARAVKTHTVKSGVNNISIKLSRDGVIVELKSAPQIGSIIMKDGSLCDTTSVVGREADAIAVVYKVAGGKAWAVGKELSSDGMAWADSSADGYSKNITDLQESNYSDGSTGLSILQREAPDAITDLENMYPAWAYACNYGKNQRLDSFQTGWYLPCKQELQEVYDQRNNMPSSLLDFGTDSYWSSSQLTSYDNGAYDNGAYNLNFGSLVSFYYKDTAYYVCAVRQFTY